MQFNYNNKYQQNSYVFKCPPLSSYQYTSKFWNLAGFVFKIGWLGLGYLTWILRNYGGIYYFKLNASYLLILGIHKFFKIIIVFFFANNVL